MSPQPDQNLSEFFTAQHRDADSHWATVEMSLNTRNAAATKNALAGFLHSMRQHLRLEEEVLFPEFIVATGIRNGPTQIMMNEHRQMRAVMDLLEEAAEKGDLNEVIGQGDGLLMLVQQHNMKEEAMLYPMSEQHLAVRWGHIFDRAQNYK